MMLPGISHSVQSQNWKYLQWMGPSTSCCSTRSNNGTSTIFVNDVFYVIVQFILYNYADDNSVSKSSEDLNEVAAYLERYEANWFKTNLLSINPNRFQCFVYGSDSDKLKLQTENMTLSSSTLRENCMVDRCVRKDSSSCDPSRMNRDHRSRVMRLGSQREESLLMHLSTIRFSFYVMVLLNLCI